MKSLRCCILPTAAAALLPKCPACIAAYLAISFTAAFFLRYAILIGGALSLVFLVIHLWRSGRPLPPAASDCEHS